MCCRRKIWFVRNTEITLCGSAPCELGMKTIRKATIIHDKCNFQGFKPMNHKTCHCNLAGKSLISTESRKSRLRQQTKPYQRLKNHWNRANLTRLTSSDLTKLATLHNTARNNCRELVVVTSERLTVSDPPQRGNHQAKDSYQMLPGNYWHGNTGWTNR